MADLPQSVRPYSSFISDAFVQRNGHHVTSCPFCETTKHFYINTETGQSDCKKCGWKGNTYSFLRKIHEGFIAASTPASHKALAKLRRIADWKIFDDAEIASIPDGDNGIIAYVPHFNRAGSLVNLRRWNGPGTRLIPVSGLSLHLFGEEVFGPKDKETVFDANDDLIVICEGEWDALSFSAAYRKLHSNDFRFTLSESLTDAGAKHSYKNLYVVAVPGADVFKDEWVAYFKDKNVLIAYDRDNAGERGVAKVSEKLSSVAKKLYKLVWPTNLPEKYDISDYFHDSRDDHAKAFTDLAQFCTPIYLAENGGGGGEVAPVVRERIFKSRPSFQTVLKEYRKVLHLDRDMEDGLAAMFAVILSNQLPGDPVWLFVVGPPGCLSGETVVELNRAGKSFKAKLEDVVKMYNGGTRGNKKWDSEIPTFIRSRDSDGMIRLFPLLRAISSGKKQLYRVTTVSGEVVDATLDHRFLTQDGWKELRNIQLVDSLFVEKKPERTVGRIKKTAYRTVEGLRYHPSMRKKSSLRFRLPYHRVVVEAYLNGLELTDYISRLRTGINLHGLSFLSDEKIVHHIDGNSANNSIDNLEVISSAEDHARLHCHEGQWRKVVAKTVLSRIKSIEQLGVQDTFDLTVGIPGSEGNFLANGIVVHNSGKTTTLLTFADSPRCIFQSSLTPHSLISGYKMDDPEKDPSLIPRLIGNTLVLKDWTEIMSMPGIVQDDLYGVLRGAYDGRAEKTFGNGMERVYSPCHFSILAGVTPAIHSHSRSTLGERFLKLTFIRPGSHDPSTHILAALTGATTFFTKEVRLRSVAYEFLDTAVEGPPEVPAKYIHRLAHLAQVIAELRAGVERSHSGDLCYRPQAEVGTRLAKQLQKLMQGLALVFGSKKADERCYQIAERVAFDSAVGWNLEITAAMINAYPKPLTALSLVELCRINKSNLNRRLGNMLELGLLNTVKLKKTTPGQPALGYLLNQRFVTLWKKAGINTKLLLKRLHVSH